MAINARAIINGLFGKVPETKPAESKPAPPPSAKAPPAPTENSAKTPQEPAVKASGNDTKKPAEKNAEFKGADHSIYQQSLDAKAKGVKWVYGARDSKLNEIDCSGWVGETQRNMIRSLQSQLDNPKKIVAESGKLVTSSAAGIVDNFAKAGAPVLTLEELKKQSPREGMLIGECNPKPPRPDNGKPRNIDHIVQTVKGPDGQIYVSESQRTLGVTLTKYEDYIRNKEKMGAKLYAVDAYQHYDKITNGQFSTIAAPQKVVEATPQTQQPANPVRSLVDAVRPTELEYVESAPPLPSTDADALAINTPPPAPATPEEVHEHLQQMTP